MALVRSGGLRWGIMLLFLILGTWLGIFLQRFNASAALFANVIDFSVDVRQVDLIMLRFGLPLPGGRLYFPPKEHAQPDNCCAEKNKTTMRLD